MSKDILKEIADSNKSVITGVDDKDIKYYVEIFIMGKKYKVPASLTIMQAMEYAGYRFTRSCGCRAGFCGACATIFRRKNSYRLETALACQTEVEDGMFLVQIPFSPAEKPVYNIEEEKYESSIFMKYFPELARCVSCNTCTKACPQDLKVMDYIQAAIRGDFEKVAELSFECIQCGLCAIRCPAEIVHYNVGQFGRRMYGKYGMLEDKQLLNMIDKLDNKEFDSEFDSYLKMGKDELVEVYKKLQASKAKYLGGGK